MVELNCYELKPVFDFSYPGEPVRYVPGEQRDGHHLHDQQVGLDLIAPP